MTERFVIWSYEHDAWWRPGRWGYTPHLAEAGHYSRDAADAIVANANIVTLNEQAIPLEAAEAFVPRANICCPRCRRRSFHPKDIVERYCGACHVFHDDIP